MGVAVGKETARTYAKSEILNMDAAPRLQAPNGCLTVGNLQVVYLLFYRPTESKSSMELCVSLSVTLTGACCISVSPQSSEQCPLKSCQKVPAISRGGIAMGVLILTHWELTKAAVVMSVHLRQD